ncbi:MAG: hypothetical protein A3F16_03870 [Deltaproteobacteria bacterium RIFCSPHIGHO2_12_FULL_43_9]|nr:MAG: hypothetical protein A3F16_03870 [Deltaproteobacteria bacterium RIFCSPHIGHO2_12_FULL_43_9]
MKGHTLSTRLLISTALITIFSVAAILLGNNTPLFVFIIVLIGLIAAMDIIHSLSPLKELECDLKRISEGEIPDKRITAKRSKEIISLIREYNRMALALSDREAKWRERSTSYHKLQGEIVRLRFVALHSEKILNSVTLGIIVITKSEIVSLTNNAFHKLWGINTTLAGLPVSQIPFISEQNDWINGIRDVLSSGSERTLPTIKAGERKLNILLAPLYEQMKPGNPGEIAASRTRFAPRNDAIDGVITLCEDVSEKILMEERLLQSERLAAVGKLAAQVAHEIRNPLNSIGLNAEYLIDRILNKKGLSENELQSLLEAIREQVNHLESVTEQYLQMTRPPETQIKATSLDELFREIDVIIRPQFSFKGVILNLKAKGSLPQLFIDPGQIRQAILNLLTNALDVSKEGDCVNLEARIMNGHVEISVQDQGPGVLTENIEKIFLPFYTTKRDGIGLGLALTKQIIEAHKGEIKYNPSMKEGSRFTIQLPVNQQ